MFNNLLIGKRLAIGFSLVLLSTLAIGVLALINTQKLDRVMHELYQEPYQASNALRDIGRRIYAMQSTLKDLAITDDEHRIQAAIERLHVHDVAINKDISAIRAVPGLDQRLVTEFVAKYQEWLQVQEAIHLSKRRGEQAQAVELIEGKSELSVLYLENFVEEFIQHANVLGEQFIHEAEATHELTNYEMYTLLFISLLVGISLSSYIARSITRPLGDVVDALDNISTGNLQHELRMQRKDELGFVAEAYQRMIGNLRHKADIADKITEGNLHNLVDVQSGHDQLAQSMNEMIHSLRLKTSENETQHWLMTGQANLALVMRGDQPLASLAENVINFLANYLNCSVGTFFVANDEHGTIDFVVGYACQYPAGRTVSYRVSDGYVGQAATEQKIMVLTDLPNDYLKISSSLGDMDVASVVVVPAVMSPNTVAVIELGANRVFTPLEIDFLQSISENIAIAVNSANARVRMADLLAESQRQSALLLSQQEELKASNDALNERTERLLASEESLKIQQEELQATNEELEEQTASLKASESRLQQQQEELQAANEELELKTESLQRQNAKIEQFSRDMNTKAVELEQASRYKSEFLANMSHELRTPLNSLLLLARTLAEETDSNLTEDQIEAATIIYNSGNDLLNLINDILDLSKIEAGQMTLDISEVRLDDLSTRLRKTFSHLADNKGLSFVVNFNDDLPEFILGDAKRIDQILKNLVSNAIKFTHQGSVSVNASLDTGQDDGQFISITVVDTGIGIASDKQSLIFEAFQQADGGTARQYGGTGLGLSISRQLAGLMKGNITLQSTPGEGTTFTLKIPIAAFVAEPTVNDMSASRGVVMAQPALNSPIRPEFEKEKLNAASSEALLSARPIADDRDQITPDDKVLLIIEDDLNFASILVSQARKNSFKTIATDNGEAGFLLAKERQPQAIVLDLSLPGIDGFKVLDYLKANAKTRHIPVHIISAMDSETDVVRRGAIGFLKKPVDKEALIDTFSHVSSIIEKAVKDLLVVEDDESVQVAIARLIGNGDVKITKAPSGEAAFKAIETGKYDCMILDLGLPDMSGFELLARLHANEHIVIPPVIVYTARDLTREETDQLREFSQSIIIKGVRSEERLLDETALFLHRIIGNLPEQKQTMIRNLYEKDSLLLNKKVLIVDDDMRNLFALSKILRDRGMKIVKAQNGQKAIDILESEDDIDLVLMDIMMPVMDGYETTRAIRANKKFSKLPVIALTAKAMKEDREKCIAVGASDYLSKPIDMDRLLSMLRVWLYQ